MYIDTYIHILNQVELKVGFWFAGVLGNAGLVCSLQDPGMLEHGWEGQAIVGTVLEKLHILGAIMERQ